MTTRTTQVRNTSRRGRESRFHEGQSRHLPIAPKLPVLVVTAVVDDADATRNNARSVNSNGNAWSRKSQLP